LGVHLTGLILAVRSSDTEKFTLAGHCHDPIGLKLDKANGIVYVADTGRSLYSVSPADSAKTELIRNDGRYTGLALV
jgi:hypothetical protein